MKIGVYFRNHDLLENESLRELLIELAKSGVETCFIPSDEFECDGSCDAQRNEESKSILKEFDLMLSVGGDGTFLSAANLVSSLGVPILGVNLGRLGFLSENRPHDVAKALLSGEYSLECRSMLKAVYHIEDKEETFYALNEISVHRFGAAMLGVDLELDGVSLPTYWADGLLVATSSGSTAYSLSAGGPIVVPESKVLIITPIAPHNLNIRPIIVPNTSKINLKFSSRDTQIIFTADNRTVNLSASANVDIQLAQFSLKRLRLNNSNFINALTSKLHWGEDIRNKLK